MHPESRKRLFNYLKKKNKVSTLKELAIKIKVPFKTINHWHYDYKKYIPENLIEEYDGKIDIIDRQPDNWGLKKGGNNGIKKKINNLRKLWKNKDYHKARSEAGKKALQIVREKYGIEELTRKAIAGRINKRKLKSKDLEAANKEFFTNNNVMLNVSGIKLNYYDKNKKILFPSEMSPELAEELGIHLGDGCLSLNKNYFSVKTNKKEREYMKSFIFPLYKKLYNLDLKLMELESVVGFEIYSAAFFEFKNKILKIPYGNKVEKILVPDAVLKTKNKQIYCAFIRGLFDTDGCVNIIKSKSNYPVVTFTIKSQGLINQVKEMLVRLGFIPSAGRWKIDLNGHIMVNKWLKEIGSNNPKNLARLKQACSSVRIE